MSLGDLFGLGGAAESRNFGKAPAKNRGESMRLTPERTQRICTSFEVPRGCLPIMDVEMTDASPSRSSETIVSFPVLYSTPSLSPNRCRRRRTGTWSRQCDRSTKRAPGPMARTSTDYGSSLHLPARCPFLPLRRVSSDGFSKS